MPRASLVTWIALALLLAPARAQAEPDLLAKARAEMANFNYDAAVGLLDKAEATGQNGREQMIEIYRAAAESHAAMGRADAAETAFRRLLALDPKAALPPGSSPKLTAPFQGARDFLAGRRLSVECRRAAEGSATLVALSDPVDLVGGARLLADDGARVPGAADARGQGRIQLAVPSGAPAALSCAALDRQGNELARVPLGAAPAPAAADDASAGAADAAGETGGVSASADRGSSRPIFARWWLWGAAAGAAGAATVYFGFKFRQAQGDFDDIQADSENHTWDEARAIQDRGERYATATNISMAVTGGLAIVSAALLVHQLVTDTPSTTETTLSAAPLPSGAAVTLSTRF